jgi:lipoprotein-releasing system permease protein
MKNLASKLEWRIAWRHLRVGERSPAWATIVLLVGAFLLAVGSGLFIYGSSLGKSGEELNLGSLVLGIDLTAYQHYLAQFGLATAAAGLLALLYASLSLFFNLLSTIITMSVLLGCMALVVALSVMSGTEQHLRRRILDQKAEILISGRDGRAFADYAPLLEAIEGQSMVVGASPYLKGEVLAVNGSMRQTAVLLGIDPARLAIVSTVPKLIESGTYESMSDPSSVQASDGSSSGPRELPWRLRHLKSLTRAKEDASPKSAAPRTAAKVKVDLPEVDAKPQQLPAKEVVDGTNAGESEDGWEDPVVELDLREKPALAELRATSKSSAPSKTAAQDRSARRKAPEPDTVEAVQSHFAGEDDEGWEDPVAELDLPAVKPEENETPDLPSGTPETKGEGDPVAIHDAVIMGRELAKELGAQVGGLVRFVTPEGRLSASGRMPGIKEVRVGGIYYSGMYQYDKTHVYAPLPVIQTFLRKPGRVSGIEVRLRNSEELEPARQAMLAVLEKLGLQESMKVETWQDLNRALFAAMFLEKIALFVALLFVVLVASFGILTSTLMSVLEKSKEIAILKAMGATDSQVRSVFVLEGLCLGMLGAAGGLIAGLAACWFLDSVGLPLQENSLYIDQLPVLVDPREVALVGISALALVLLVTIYPARVASQVRPVEALRMNDR